jgi:NAD(P)-dependent dehydrogenase (short-subunit alcohol dehydrogenase family)
MNREAAYAITGPTSGIGYKTALELAAHGTVILVGRSREKLAAVKAEIEHSGGHAVTVVGDLSDIGSVRRAAREIVGLPYKIAGVLNNAGVMATSNDAKAADGKDLTFATNYLGAFAFTDELVPHLPDGANVVFIGSAIEDPDRAPAKAMGMKGGQFISVEASTAGRWKAGGAKMAGVDAYATSKQCVLAAGLGLARENPRLHFNVVEPGITPGTGLGGVHNPLLGFLFGQIITRLPPFSQYRSTPDKSAKTIARAVTDTSGASGVYLDEKGKPMRGSALAHDRGFQDRLIADTRSFLLQA